mmetsp:Transcript_83178/g.239053  ORF Transcript_83178/g.239053 Transcript_83178/m.239053 type:complete len:280 (-) Transcript_83178:15-854(-)
MRFDIGIATSRSAGAAATAATTAIGSARSSARLCRLMFAPRLLHGTPQIFIAVYLLVNRPASGASSSLGILAASGASERLLPRFLKRLVHDPPQNLLRVLVPAVVVVHGHLAACWACRGRDVGLVPGLLQDPLENLLLLPGLLQDPLENLMLLVRRHPPLRTAPSILVPRRPVVVVDMMCRRRLPLVAETLPGIFVGVIDECRHVRWRRRLPAPPRSLGVVGVGPRGTGTATPWDPARLRVPALPGRAAGPIEVLRIKRARHAGLGLGPLDAKPSEGPA